MKKKVLIISQDGFEETTDHVIDWIDALGGTFERINGSIIEEHNSGKKHYVSNTKWTFLKSDIDDIKAVWFRRWGGGHDCVRRIGNVLDVANYDYPFQRYYTIANNVVQELGAVTSYILYRLEEHGVKFLTKPHQINVHKLVAIDWAKRLGLLVPDYLVTNNKEDLLRFLKSYGKVITKDINAPFSYYHPKERMLLYTEIVGMEEISRFPDYFPLSLVQEYIEKDFEIRSFYLKGEFYSMAIFSQKDSKTEVDFRKYNIKRPNRTVPYLLPAEVQQKLHLLMERLGLETGSFDIIKTKNDQFYFLEVNPVGQFGMVSYPCNYKIERLIAQYLLDE